MLSADFVDISFTSGDWVDVTVTLVVWPDVTATSPFVTVLPDSETDELVADVVPGVCPDVTASPCLAVVMVVSPIDVALVTNPSVDGPVDCVPVMDTLVVSGALDDGPVVGDDSVASAVLSVMPVDIPVVPVSVTVSLLVCSP